MDEAAKKIGVDPKRLAKWESGEGDDRPTVKKLFKIANVYKRPFAAFYFSSPPTHWDEPYDKLEDWRTLPETESAKKSTGLVLELREAARRREILLELAEEMNEEIGKFDQIRLRNESPTALAKRVRFALGKSVSDQKSCSHPRDALRMWRSAVEELNVLVFQTGFFNRNSVPV
ncbi:MAG: helix-turn-helix domain-containing protein, partial [Anaerolineae bacterium]|nr:helix-turn-helix domain-containing protein [Anaerolineae bacterium]